MGRCREWLTSKPRDYPGVVLCWEIFAHVVSWLLQTAGLVCEIAGLIEHTIRFQDDPGATAGCLLLALIVVATLMVQLQLIVYRFMRYRNAFRLGFVLCLISAIIYTAVWIGICGPNVKTPHFSNLLLGLPILLCLVSLIVYLAPLLIYECCHKEDNVPQVEVPLQQVHQPPTPPPSYAEAMADQGQQSRHPSYQDLEMVRMVLPPRYSPPRDPSEQPPGYSETYLQRPSQQPSSSSPSSSLTHPTRRPPSTSRKTDQKWVRVDDDDDDDNDDRGTKSSRAGSQRGPRQAKSREARGSTGKTRSRSRSRSGGRSLGRGMKTRSQERTRLGGAGSSRGRRAGGGRGETAKQTTEGPITRSRSLRRRTSRVVY